jgi:hypothetical protein
VSGPYYDGVTAPDPERQRLFLSVFNPSPLEEVAEAVSVASESLKGPNIATASSLPSDRVAFAGRQRSDGWKSGSAICSRGWQGWI